MSDRREYLGEALSHAHIARRREAQSRQQAEGVRRVDALVRTQQSLGTQLGDGLTELRDQSAALEQLDRPSQDSFLSGLVRPFTARRAALARRSIAEGLLQVYERTSASLRQATGFADELKRCALELQQEVDRLHRDLGEALHNEGVAAHRVLEAEAALQELEGLEIDRGAAARRRDRYTIDLKTEAVHQELYAVAATQCRQHLGPARALRDTVLQLHEDMARYVVNATHTVNAAGRRIQGLGLMADAPVVVQDLQESLDELGEAMAATVHYIEQSRRLIEDVLPDLSAKLDAHDELEDLTLTTSLEQVDRGRARKQAERRLRESADREIDDLLGKGS